MRSFLSFSFEDGCGKGFIVGKNFDSPWFTSNYFESLRWHSWQDFKLVYCEIVSNFDNNSKRVNCKERRKINFNQSFMVLKFEPGTRRHLFADTSSLAEQCKEEIAVQYGYYVEFVRPGSSSSIEGKTLERDRGEGKKKHRDQELERRNQLFTKGCEKRNDVLGRKSEGKRKFNICRQLCYL